MIFGKLTSLPTELNTKGIYFVFNEENKDINGIYVTSEEGIHRPFLLQSELGKDGYTPYIVNDMWYINGNNTGKPSRGVKGDNGKTNYQLALENGFIGSLDDYLLSLKGEKGDAIKGDQGDRGFTPYIGDNFHWFIDVEDLGIDARGLAFNNINDSTITTNNTWSAYKSNITFVNKNIIGQPNGIAELDNNGLILSSQLPSYVDDVLDGSYISNVIFNDLNNIPYTPESNKIYVDINTNITYRWSGSIYAVIGSSLALGETSLTAYRGDRGKIAYDHSQVEHQTVINGIGLARFNGKDITFDNNNYYLASNPNGYTTNVGTVTSIAGFSVNTNGADISTSVINSTVSPSITISIPSASALNRGVLTSLDWINFNSKQSALGYTPEQQLSFGTGLSRTGNTIINTVTDTNYYPTSLSFNTITGYLSISGVGINTLSDFIGIPSTVGTAGNTLAKRGSSGELYALSFYGDGSHLTGITASLGYTPWYSGNHPTTISDYGITDAILNQNSSAQSASMWISGSISTDKYGETFRSVGTTDVPKSLRLSNGVADAYFGIDDSNGSFFGKGSYSTNIYSPTRNLAITSLNFTLASTGAATFASTVSATQFNGSGNNALFRLNSLTNGYGAFIAYDLNSAECMGFAVDSTNSSFKFKTGVEASSMTGGSFMNIVPDFEIKTGQALINGNIVYHTGNLTNNLTTNYIPKWNGSSFVNSLISDNGTNVLIAGVQPFFKGGSSTGRFVVGNDNTTSYAIAYGSGHSTEPSTYEISSLRTKFFTNSLERLRIANTGEVNVYSTTPSTSPTTGALVVDGGVGVGGNGYFSGILKSQLIQVFGTSGLPNNSGTSQIALARFSTGDGTNINTSTLDIGSQNSTGTGWIQATDRNSLSSNYALLLNPNGGNVSIGYTTDQSYKLAVNGSGYFNGGINAASSTFLDNTTPPVKWGSTSTNYGMLDWYSAGFAAMYGVSGIGLKLGANGSIDMLNIYTNGNTSIGYTVDQGYKLAVNGTVYSSNTITATNFIGSSDARLKNIYSSIVPQKLNIDYKEYEFKNQLGIRRFGVIAQDLLSNGYDKFVDKSNKMYGVNYIDLLISEIVYLKYKVEELERRIK